MISLILRYSFHDTEARKRYSSYA